jgi:FlaG/FlaF family flagellin (archaellin)
MKYIRENREAVSELVGEMLMLSLVLILMAVFSAGLSSYLPVERSPSVTLIVTADDQSITFWHKGGDWVKKSDLQVTVMNETASTTFTAEQLVLDPDTTLFDLGSSLSVPYSPEGGEEVRVITPRAVIYSGQVVV